ncbi:MAG: hypothetical protein R6X21_12225, partial [Candidatus Aminicenantes bacterium]
GRVFAHTVTIASVAVSFLASLAILGDVAAGQSLSAPLYTWIAGDGWSIHVGGKPSWNACRRAKRRCSWPWPRPEA